MKSQFNSSHTWNAPSRDPKDEQFGDVTQLTSLDDAEEYDCVFVGEPYDGGHIVGRPGARKGPKVLRRQLEGTKTHHYHNGPIQSIGDLGDIIYPMGQSVSHAQNAFLDVTTKIHAKDTLPIFLGGDHSLAYSNVKPLLDKHNSVGVINLDSHADVRTLIDGQPHTGTPFRQLIDDGLDAYTQVGARQFGLSSPYVEYLDDHDVQVVTAEEVGLDIESSINRALSSLADVDAIYVSFDVDVLDTSTAPGTSSTEPGGLLSREANYILRSIAQDRRIAGFGIYEFSPMLDSDNVTGIAGARALTHFLSGYQSI